jgi:hypothetical protein
MQQNSSRFDFLFLEAVDEALNSLGESIKKSVYFHLEETYNIKRFEIPTKVAAFSNALEKMFGVGSRHIEILVMKNLFSKIEITCDWSVNGVGDLSFNEYVDLMRKEFSKLPLKAKMEFFIEDYGNKKCITELDEKIV